MKSKGAALITVLIVLALITPILTYVSLKHSLGISRTLSLNDTSRVTNYALAVETWARSLLLKDAQTNRYDSFIEPWAQPLPPILSDGVEIEGKITDLQSKFNLNILGSKEDPELKLVWLSVLKNSGLAVSDAIALTQSIEDWIDADSETRLPSGAEDAYYMSLRSPYRAANQLLADMNELYLIHGMNQEIFKLMNPFIVALPETTIKESKVNINTASFDMLKAIFAKREWSVLEKRFLQRQEKPFYTMEVFRKHYKKQLKKDVPDYLNNILGTGSQYFLLEASIGFNNQQITIRSFLKRNKRGVKVLSRNLL